MNERFFGRLRGEQRETALQLNRRIEFKVLRTNYKPGPNSLFNPNQMAVAAEEGTKKIKGGKRPFFYFAVGRI